MDGRREIYLGYAAGNEEDVRRYFNHKKTGYQIHLQEIQVLNLTTEAVDRYELLKEEHRRADAEVGQKAEAVKRLERTMAGVIKIATPK